MFFLVCWYVRELERFQRAKVTFKVIQDRSTDVAMAINFRVKMGEIGRFTFIRRLSIPKRSGISQF